MPEKPLHIRVAEALGWTFTSDGLSVISPSGGRWAYNKGTSDPIPRYDWMWDETGPLIERLKIDVWFRPGGFAFGPDEWGATSQDSADAETGATPLLAVCNLIVSLKAAGKL